MKNTEKNTRYEVSYQYIYTTLKSLAQAQKLVKSLTKSGYKGVSIAKVVTVTTKEVTPIK
jgi:hypothetical protein